MIDGGEITFGKTGKDLTVSGEEITFAGEPLMRSTGATSFSAVVSGVMNSSHGSGSLTTKSYVDTEVGKAYPSADSDKVNHLTVTKATNLDTLSADVTANTAKTSFPGFGTSSSTVLRGNTTTITTAQSDMLTDHDSTLVDITHRQQSHATIIDSKTSTDIFDPASKLLNLDKITNFIHMSLKKAASLKQITAPVKGLKDGAILKIINVGGPILTVEPGGNILEFSRAGQKTTGGVRLNQFENIELSYFDNEGSPVWIILTHTGIGF